MEDINDLIELVSDVPEAERFEVKDLKSANWTVATMGMAESRIQARKALADSYRQKIDAWLEAANRDDLETVDRMQELLRPWVVTELAAGKGKSVKLLGGVAGFRSSPASVEVTDEAAAIDFCETFHPEAVRVKKELSRSAAKELLKAGNQIEGVSLAPGAERFYVKLEAPDEV